jgi:hypothetical protein
VRFVTPAAVTASQLMIYQYNEFCCSHLKERYVTYMPLPPIGVANSISANFQFDPLDTIEFARQGKFEIIQIYLNDFLLEEDEVLAAIRNHNPKFQQVYYHAEGFLNEDFLKSNYRWKLFQFLQKVDSPNYILHFDERANVDKQIRVVETLGKNSAKIFLENYFLSSGKVEAEKNFKKYLALFTLSRNFGHTIYPVLDIPRLFHRNLEFNTAEALEWCYQILNFFGNRNIPLLLHLIDATTPDFSRFNFSPIGRGYIPYHDIFKFIRKTRPHISGIILEFEDKINPLQSREYIVEVLGEG